MRDRRFGLLSGYALVLLADLRAGGRARDHEDGGAAARHRVDGVRGLVTTPSPRPCLKDAASDNSLRGHFFINFLRNFFFPTILQPHSTNSFIRLERKLEQRLLQDRLHGVDGQTDVVADGVRVSSESFIICPRIGQY